MKKFFPTLDQISRNEKGETLKAITINKSNKQRQFIYEMFQL